MSDETATESTRPDAPVPVPGAWWKAVVAGVLLCIPVGWLLSYGGGLPFFIGLFFYMLLGVLVSALMYRFGHRARPIPAWNLRLGIALVVFVGWGVSIWVEAYEFPDDVAKRTLNSPLLRVRPGGRPPEAIKQEAVSFTEDHLRERFPPGGVIGYFRWVLAEDHLDVTIRDVPHPVRLRYSTNGGWWIFRVLASLGLFLYGVRSLVRVLREREPDGNKAAEPDPDAEPSQDDESQTEPA